MAEPPPLRRRLSQFPAGQAPSKVLPRYVNQDLTGEKLSIGGKGSSLNFNQRVQAEEIMIKKISKIQDIVLSLF